MVIVKVSRILNERADMHCSVKISVPCLVRSMREVEHEMLAVEVSKAATEGWKTRVII